MCLVTACPEGTKKGGEKFEGFIRNGFQTNSDGSGYAFKRKNSKEIVLKKGYQNADEMIADLKALDLQDEDELIIHHRIGTSGSDPIRNTHPFVVAFDFEEITQVECTTDKPVLAHNGIFTGYGSTGINPKYNDTVHWIHLWLSNPNILKLLKEDPENFDKLYGKVTDLSFNKIAMLFPDTDMVILGKFTEDEGYYHSNDCYKNTNWRDRGGKGKNFHTEGVQVRMKNATQHGSTTTVETKKLLPSPKSEVDGFSIRTITIANTHLKSIQIENEFLKLMPSHLDNFFYFSKRTNHCNEFLDKDQTTSFPNMITINSYPYDGRSSVISFTTLLNDYRRVVKKDFVNTYIDIKELIVNYGYDLSKSKHKKFRKIFDRAVVRGKKLLILKDTKLLIGRKAFGMYLTEVESRMNKTNEKENLLLATNA